MAKQELEDIFKKRTRHPYRPRASDVIDKIFPNFNAVDIHEGSLIAGSCRFMNKRLFVIGQQKPKPSDLKSYEDLDKLNYGMLTSDDHSLILSILEQAERSDPERTYLFCIIDT